MQSIDETVIVRCAQHAASWTAQYLHNHEKFTLGEASELAQDAGNAFAQALTRAIRERNITINPV